MKKMFIVAILTMLGVVCQPNKNSGIPPAPYLHNGYKETLLIMEEQPRQAPANNLGGMPAITPKKAARRPAVI